MQSIAQELRLRMSSDRELPRTSPGIPVLQASGLGGRWLGIGQSLNSKFGLQMMNCGTASARCKSCKFSSDNRLRQALGIDRITALAMHREIGPRPSWLEFQCNQLHKNSESGVFRARVLPEVSRSAPSVRFFPLALQLLD